MHACCLLCVCVVVSLYLVPHIECVVCCILRAQLKKQPLLAEAVIPDKINVKKVQSGFHCSS